jgi:hypothetical protein
VALAPEATAWLFGLVDIENGGVGERMTLSEITSSVPLPTITEYVPTVLALIGTIISEFQVPEFIGTPLRSHWK